MRISSDQYRKMQNNRKLQNAHSESKYASKGQYYNGSYYQSIGERDYAQGLDFRKKAGDIKDWRRQVKIELRVRGRLISNYYMDFEVTHNDGTIELIEYKGFVTKDWKQKWQLLHALKDELYPNGVTITLVKHQSKYKFNPK